jgi:hypothetical protein
VGEDFAYRMHTRGQLDVLEEILPVLNDIIEAKESEDLDAKEEYPD